MLRRPFNRIIPLAVLFLSGSAGLGYQIVWTRMFSTGLGHEIPAVLAVITAFFSGAALGAWWLDRPISGSRRPWRWFAGLELTIGLWAVGSAGLIPLVNREVAIWIGLDPAPLRHWLLTFVVPLVLLLPATVAMGASLPAAERWVAPGTPDGRCVGALYAANTLGAVVGVLAGAFLLIPALGYQSSVRLLGCLNLLCAVVAWRFDRASWRQPAEADRSGDDGGRPNGLNRILFFTGLLGIGYEVLGVRALSEVLEGTVYTFAATLSVFLLGTALGAALYQTRLRRLPFEPVKNGLLAGLAAVSAAGVLVMVQSHSIYPLLRRWWGDAPMAVTAAELAMATAVFGVPTIFMGAVFAHSTQHSRGRNGGVGRAVGLNTLGCALAPAVFGAALLPVLGLKWAFAVLIAGYLALAPWRPVFLVPGAMLLTALIAWLPARNQWLVLPPAVNIVSHRDGVMDSVTVIGFPDRNRSLLVNSRFGMGGTGSIVAERRHAQIPLLLHPDPRRALFLGLGTGITFAAAGSHPGLTADGVELVPEVVGAMPFFAPFNDLPPGGQRLKVYTADARRFVRAASVKYDVIVADLFHPARDGAGMLYTREHFEAIRQRLASCGLFCQWLPLHQLDEPMLKVIIRTFLEVFPKADAFLLRFNVDTPVLGLMGGLESRGYATPWLEKRVRDPGLSDSLKSLALTDDLQLFGTWLAGAEALRTFVGDSILNTDDRPVVVFGAPRFYYRNDSRPHGRLSTLLELSASDPGWLKQPVDRIEANDFGRRLAAFVGARNVYLRGLISEADGNLASAIDDFVESARISPDFSTGYARCLTIAMQQSGPDRRGARALLERLVGVRPERPVAAELLKRLEEP